MYRTPQHENKEFLIRLDSLLEQLAHKEKNLILAGDFNIDILKNSTEAKELKNTLTRHGMNYLVNFPTRITETSESCLDNFFTNLNKDCAKATGIVTALSDHDGQILNIMGSYISKENQNLTYTGRNFSVENMKLFNSLLEKEDWLSLFNSPVEEKYDCFDSIFQYYFNQSFPVVKKKIKHNKKSWISQDLKDQNIINLSREVKHSKSHSLKNEFKYK